MNRDERYIRIAKACLKAINDVGTTPTDRQNNIQRVYEAIDQAFRQEFATLEKENHLVRQYLQQIADLDEDASESARDIAADALNQINAGIHEGSKH